MPPCSSRMRRDRRFTRFRFESDRRAISALRRPQAELFVILRNAEHYRFGVGPSFARRPHALPRPGSANIPRPMPRFMAHARQARNRAGPQKNCKRGGRLHSNPRETSAHAGALKLRSVDNFHDQLRDLLIGHECALRSTNQTKGRSWDQRYKAEPNCEEQLS
jgi:hypothetical protein